MKTHAKQLKKCPFCRTAIKSKALNISLQDLIRTSQEQELKPTKPLTIKEGKRQSEFFDIPDADEADQEILEIRLSILIQEKQDMLQVLIPITV